MTHQTEPLALLRDTEHYLSALHGSVARHDNLAANYGCAGCELRDRITAAVSAAVAPPTNQTALRETVAEKLATADGWTWAHGLQFKDISTPSADAYRKLANAVLALLPTAGRASVLREGADVLGRMDYDADSNDYGYDTYRDAWNGGVMDAADRLRRMADETATETPAPDDRNAGPGWYEVITSPQATTCIAYVHEDGSLYLPEGDLTEEEFAFAAARGKAHRLVRADEQPAAGARQDGAQP
jgi:hypothetical protein